MPRADLLETPPYRAVDGRRVHYGRYSQPIPRPNIDVPGHLGKLRLKEWHYTSVLTERFFFAFGLVQLGYVANAFCYLVDRQAPKKLHQYEALAPLGRGLRFAPSSILGLTRWKRGRARIAVGWDKGWGINMSVPLSGGRLEAELIIEPRECLALLHELEPMRPAYTHKAAALPTAGFLRWRGERWPVKDGLACLDWTRSAALRETRWKWLSLATALDDGRTVGLNLSAEVYDDRSGGSRENALWLDGLVEPVSGVMFELPRDPKQEPWKIRSRCGTEVDLIFHPLGARSQNVKLGLIQSRFTQPYGTFEGRLRPQGSKTEQIELDGAFGVVEDHLAVW